MNVLITTGVFGLVMMFGGLFIKNQSNIKYLAILGTICALFANWMDGQTLAAGPVLLYNMIEVSTFSVTFNYIAIGATLLYFILSGSAIEKVGKDVADYFALMFFILAGITVTGAFSNLLMLFLCIEIISIPQYILAGADKRNLKSNEASLKYFLMGSFITGILLMGIALIYGATGTFTINEMQLGSGDISPLAICGVLLLAFGLAFKVSAAPFHFWTPDVYDGSPTVFTSFMSTVVKAAGFIAFIRLFHTSFAAGSLTAEWQHIIALITAATLLVGNITAVFQQSVKRMLAYSSIAQAGFMLFAIISVNTLAVQGIILYAAAYSVATIGLFAILIQLQDSTYEGFNGLGKQQPLVAVVATILLFSLAGIPLTAGFFAKYFVLSAAIQQGGLLWLVIVGLLGAAISVYYYFKVIMAIWFKAGTPVMEPIRVGFKVALVVTAAIIILLGVAPNVLLNLL
jgi:NADH-quinone oxidoreductase subunit N